MNALRDLHVLNAQTIALRDLRASNAPSALLDLDVVSAPSDLQDLRVKCVLSALRDLCVTSAPNVLRELSARCAVQTFWGTTVRLHCPLF